MQAPTASELLQNATVRQALEEAWNDSLAGDPQARHEEGGWIYLQTAIGQIFVQRALRGEKAAIDLSQPLTFDGMILVGKFHTHPNPSAEGWNPGPSENDQRIDALHGVPDLIRADSGVFVSGPDSRRGGLAGPPGYPLPETTGEQ